MTEYLPQILTVAGINLLAIMSPGPDFIMITRNSLMYSRKTAVYSALGLSLGILVHIAYSLIGVGFLISQSIILFSLIKIIGALYLIYIGYKSLADKSNPNIDKSNFKTKDLSTIEAIKMGFLTNVSNPKVTLFFLSIFTLVIKPNTPVFIKLVMGMEMSLATFIWFAIVAIIFTNKLIKQKISKVQHYAEKLMGVILIALGIKIAFSTTNK